MEKKKLYQFGAWSGFLMALMLIINGIFTFIDSPWLFWISRIGIVLAGFGVLPAIWHMAKDSAPGWVTWLTAIAFLGLSAEALLYLGQADIYTPWLLFGGLGIWAMGMNLVALVKKIWHPWLSILGILGGCLLLAAMIANTIEANSWVNQLSAGLGAVVLYPAWLTWIGVRNLKV